MIPIFDFFAFINTQGIKIYMNYTLKSVIKFSQNQELDYLGGSN